MCKRIIHGLILLSFNILIQITYIYMKLFFATCSIVIFAVDQKDLIVYFRALVIECSKRKQSATLRLYSAAFWKIPYYSRCT